MEAPELPEGHYFLGWSWEIKGDWEKAEANFRNAFKADSEYAPARFRLGRLLIVREILSREAGFSLSSAESDAVLREAMRHLAAVLDESTGLKDEFEREIAAALMDYARGNRLGTLTTVTRAVMNFGDSSRQQIVVVFRQPGDCRFRLDATECCQHLG